MTLFLPTCAKPHVTDISRELLNRMGARVLLIDVDNTLALPNSLTPLPGVPEWTVYLREAGFHLILMSNNSAERVKPFAKKLNLPFCSRSAKPLPHAFWHAARLFGTTKREAVVVGDQIFTDVLGANLARMKSILVLPTVQETGISFRIRRRLEKSLCSH